MNFFSYPFQVVSLCFIVLGTIASVTLPTVAIRVMHTFKRATAVQQKAIWITGEVVLALALSIQFLYAGALYCFCAGTISPYLWAVNPHTISLSDPLTMRAFFYWTTPIFVSWIMFRHAGLFMIRDIHKTIKEQGDVVYARKMSRLTKKNIP